MSPGTFGTQSSAVVVDGVVISETHHAPGLTLDNHAHEFASANLVVAGVYRERVHGEVRSLGQMTLAIKPAGAAHSNHFDSAGARCVLVELADPSTALVERIAPAFAEICDADAGTGAMTGLHLVRELRHPHAGTPFVLDTLVTDLFTQAQYIGHVRMAETRAPWLLQVWEMLHDAPCCTLTLSQVAARVGKHPVYVARAFRKRFGTGLGEYVRRLQISRATRHLMERRTSISRVALDAGFYDQSHFTRTFRDVRGVTPGEFRRVAGRTSQVPIVQAQRCKRSL